MVAEFDVSEVSPDSVVFVIGKRMTGKTVIARDIVARSGVEFGMAVSPLAPIQPEEYADVPVVVDEWHPKLVGNLLKRQRAAIKSGIQDPRAFVVLDNCMYDPKWYRDPDVKSMFLNNRAMKLLVVMTSGFAMSASPSIKSNVDFVFVMRSNTESHRRGTWTRYVDGIATFDDFNALMDSLVGYWCLVVDCRKGELFRYKSAVVTPSRLQVPAPTLALPS